MAKHTATESAALERFINEAEEQTVHILRILSKCEQREIRDTRVEKKFKQVSNWCLAVSFLLLSAAALFTWVSDPRSASDTTKFFVLSACLLSAIFSAIALLMPVALSLLLLSKWKDISFRSLCDDIRYEHVLIKQLLIFNAEELSEAKFWLMRKLQRITARTSRFFGGKTAAVGLIATAYSFAAQFGGFDWVASTLAKGFSIDNLGNTILLYIGAALIGVSIGAMLLEKVASRYRYHVELLELLIRHQKKHGAACNVQ